MGRGGKEGKGGREGGREGERREGGSGMRGGREEGGERWREEVWGEMECEGKMAGRERAEEKNRKTKCVRRKLRKGFEAVMRSLRDKVYRDGTGHCEQFQVKGMGVIFFITERGGGLES